MLHARSHLVDQPRTTREDVVNDLKAAGIIVTKKTIGNTLRREGLKSCSARKVPLLKKAHVQAPLKFANDSDENWVKVLWSDETKIELFGINSTRCAWRRRNAAYDPKNTIPISGVHRPPEGQGRNGVTRAQSGGITIHDFITILCHVGFSILQAVWAVQPN